VPVKKSKPRTATTERRIKKYAETYRSKTVPLWYKKAIPVTTEALEEWLTNQDELEQQLFQKLTDEGVPTEEWVYYTAFGKRLLNRCLNFTSETYDMEKTSLRNEFIARGLNSSVLDKVIEVSDNKCGLIRGIVITVADEKVKISVTDTTTDYLIAKLLAGTGISLTQLNPGGNEQLRIDALTQTHNLLSATHLDALAAAVVRGDLIVGNSTPRWSRLPIGFAKRVLRSDGVDPSWAHVWEVLSDYTFFILHGHDFDAQSFSTRYAWGAYLISPMSQVNPAYIMWRWSDVASPAIFDKNPMFECYIYFTVGASNFDYFIHIGGVSGAAPAGALRHFGIEIDTVGNISIRSGDGAVTSTTGALGPPLGPNTWYHIRCKLYSANYIELWVNGFSRGTKNTNLPTGSLPALHSLPQAILYGWDDGQNKAYIEAPKVMFDR